MRLYLVQHGAAKSKAEDPERPLTDAGVQSVERAARWASQVRVEVHEIRHSGKRRAAETAEIFARQLQPPGGVRAVSGLDPTDEVRPVAAALERETDALMLVGHLPFLERLAGQLVAADPDQAVARFTNGGILCLGREEGRWSIHWALPSQLMR